MDGQKDGQMDEWMDRQGGQMIWMDGWVVDVCMDGWMDCRDINLPSWKHSVLA